MNKLLFIITGSIAATRCKEIFKSINLKEYEISCVLTSESKKYLEVRDIKKYTNGRVFTDKSETNNKFLHINLSRQNDLILVCPATANTIAKFANGYGDNLASNILLATNKKIIFVPAMNSQMWLNKANKKNVRVIKNRGHEFIGPEIGNLKCGEFGPGRISNTNKIIKNINETLKSLNLFKNKRCLVTAGPTIEMIDPIRYITNQSSGKQGFEIASQLAVNGAKVTLISGPTKLDPPTNVKYIKIKSAKEMYKKILTIRNVDIGFFTAAVSDYKSKKVLTKKFKKKKQLDLNLVKNIDILESIGNNKYKRPKYLVGFAAETGSVSLAKEKLINKNCDIIIYNKISDKNQVFGSDFNQISIVTRKEIKHLKKMTKVNCAKKIIEYVYNHQLQDE